ncbi:conserved Plasmodium protein, unknown function [Plasmodium gaboni]|uniref:Uncharacterized protein n=1 Tax=Plasmodium gaboni TaxID=647221 RepID=A0ABY1ULN8_9APIC|nr:conserved Plasmodium protein, unknown function [Plasmodium gaboni]
MYNDEIKIIEKEYKAFYLKFEYIDQNTFCIHLKKDDIIKEEEKKKKKIIDEDKNNEENIKIITDDKTKHKFLSSKYIENDNILIFYIKNHPNYFEILNNTSYNDIKVFENIEQLFNVYCPLSFKNFICEKIQAQLNKNK